MRIEIIDVALEDKGKYKMLEATYKNNDGKVTSKKLMSFGGSVAAYEALKDAKKGDVWEVTAAKNDKGFWDWVSVAKPGAASIPSAGSGNPAPRSNFETPEERAARQVYIVRQSSLSAAIELQKLNNPKGGVAPDQVIEVAKVFENFVFGKGAEFLADLPDDIPV